MLQRLNQLNLPDWFEHCHWMREIVCVNEPYVEGDLTLYPDGDATIGTRMFRTGIPIDEWPFAGGYIAKRRIDRPEWLLIRTPGGIHHYYRYREIVGFWERYTPYEDPSLDEYVESFGPRLGSFLRSSERSITRTCQEVTQMFVGLVWFGIGYFKWYLIVTAVFLIVQLIALLAG